MTVGCLGFESGGYGPNAIVLEFLFSPFKDVAPNHAGVLFGYGPNLSQLFRISNAIATLPGIVGVAATGIFVSVVYAFRIYFARDAVLVRSVSDWRRGVPFSGRYLALFFNREETL